MKMSMRCCHCVGSPLAASCVRLAGSKSNSGGEDGSSDEDPAAEPAGWSSGSAEELDEPGSILDAENASNAEGDPLRTAGSPELEGEPCCKSSAALMQEA